MNKYREELRKEYEGETGMYWAHESTLWANWLESKLEQAEKVIQQAVEDLETNEDNPNERGFIGLDGICGSLKEFLTSNK